jgi:hypothetical protein
MKRKPELLAIGSQQALELAREALGNDVDIVQAPPIKEPNGDGADLALADVRFGRARIERLLQTLNETADARALPIIACAAPVPAAFIDARRLTRQYGKHVASELLRRIVASRSKS